MKYMYNKNELQNMSNAELVNLLREHAYLEEDIQEYDRVTMLFALENILVA